MRLQFDHAPRSRYGAASGAVLARRLLLVIALCGLVVPAVADADSMPPIKHVFVLIDENESASTTFGPSSPAPYLSKTLVAQGAYLPNYYGIGHSSLDNYIAMVSGQAPNPLTSGDCPNFVDFPADSLDPSGQENGEGCVYPADVPTLMSQLDAAHLTWRAYEDSMGADPARESATCGHPAVGSPDNTEVETATDQYATRHDPFVYFHYVIDNASECSANVVGLSQLSTDLQSAATTPNYVFITPSLCNDGHDTPCDNGQPGGLTQADSFLQTWVPQITSSPAFQQDGLLIITFDEAVNDDTACCGETPGPYDAANGVQPGGGGPGGGDVGAVLLSPFIAPGTTSSVSYNHYSMLASIEGLFGLSRIGDAVGVSPFGSDIYRQEALQVALAGSGSGSVSGAGIACPGACSVSVSQGSQVTLTAAPASGSSFAGWSGGGCSGTGLCTVTMSSGEAVTATFTRSTALSAAQIKAVFAGEIAPSGKLATIPAIVKRGGFTFARFKLPEAGAAVLSWYQAHGSKLTLTAIGRLTLSKAGTGKLTVKLTAAGRKLLKRANSLKLTGKGKFTPTSQPAVSTNKTFTLRK